MEKKQKSEEEGRKNKKRRLDKKIKVRKHGRR